MLNKVTAVILIAMFTLTAFSCGKGKQGVIETTLNKPSEITTDDVTITTPDPIVTTPGEIELPISPDAFDDGTRLSSWLSPSYVKVIGSEIENDNGNVYDFKDYFGNIDQSLFNVYIRKPGTDELTELSVTNTKCPYGNYATVYGNSGSGVFRVDATGDESNIRHFNLFTNPGLIYMISPGNNDLLMSFTAPEDGTYDVRASAIRAWKCYSKDGNKGSGSRFFIEANGEVIDEGIDEAEKETKRINLSGTVELKKGEKLFFGHDPIAINYIPYCAAADDATINYFIVEKRGESVDSAERTTNKINVNMAKNELESFQVSVNSKTDVGGLKIKLISEPIDNIDIEYLEEFLINTNEEFYPDPIVPSDGEFDVKANETKTMLVRFKTNKKTTPGTYTFRFRLESPSGWELEKYTVTLKVYNITLPDEVMCDTATYVNKDIVKKFELIPDSKMEEFYKGYYDLLLSYKVNAYYLPYDILDSRADEYMSDPRVTSFQVWSDASDEMIKLYYEKLKSNPVWLEKAYFYPFDEPTTTDHLNTLAKKCERLKKLAPEIDIVIPFFVNIQYDENMDEVDFLEQYVGVWCPKSACWNETFLKNPLSRPYFGDRMDEQKAQGDRIWWYVCWEPGYPYCNLYVNELGIHHRELFWQQYLYGSDGLLYWSSTSWGNTVNPWYNMATVPGLSKNVYGDGSLLYPAKQLGIIGGCASLRLEIIRDGIEDFTIFKLAEDTLGREWVISKINLITTSLTEHISSSEEFAMIRNEIMQEYENSINE